MRYLFLTVCVTLIILGCGESAFDKLDMAEKKIREEIGLENLRKWAQINLPKVNEKDTINSKGIKSYWVNFEIDGISGKELVSSIFSKEPIIFGTKLERKNMGRYDSNTKEMVVVVAESYFGIIIGSKDFKLTWTGTNIGNKKLVRELGNGVYIYHMYK